jgi:hypothetical protein
METNLASLKPLAQHLPKPAIGFCIPAAGLFIILMEQWITPPSDQSGAVIAFVTLLTTAVYWFFCLYRLHQVLARADASYPISPVKAVAYCFMPLFQLYWMFKWPREVARLVNTLSKSEQMSGYYAGLLLLAAIVLEIVASVVVDNGRGTSLGFLLSAGAQTIFFAVLVYVVGELRCALTFTAQEFELLDTIQRRRRRTRETVLDASLGAGFALTIYYGFASLLKAGWGEQLKFLIVTAVVLVGIVRFLERLMQAVRRRMGLPFERHSAHADWMVQLAALFIVVVVGALHAILHETVNTHPAEVVGILTVSLLLIGGITWMWVLGMRSTPHHAALYGGTLGALAGGLTMFIAVGLVGTATDPVPLGGVHHSAPPPPLSPAQIELAVAVNALTWGLLGSLGGLALNRRWGKRPGWGVLCAMVVTTIVITLPVAFFETDPWGFMVGLGKDLVRVIGWGAALVLSTAADDVLRPKHAAAAAAEASIASSVPQTAPHV